jgi:NarL family two-component system response regulator LiaR
MTTPHLVRQGVIIALELFDDFHWVGEASNGAEAVNLCPELNPDVILMDLNMPIMDGATATLLIKKCCPQVKVIILTSFKDEVLVNAALLAGASSYLLKNVSIDRLASEIRAVSCDDGCEARDFEGRSPANET